MTRKDQPAQPGERPPGHPSFGEITICSSPDGGLDERLGA